MIEIAMTTLIINIRYFLMSLSVSQKVESKMSMKKRLGIAYGITDEIFAVSMQQPRKLTASYMAGLILTARLGSAQSTSGTGIEMDAIAAVILGGTSLSGGVGFVLPTVVGAMIMGIIDNILTLMNVNPHATNIVKGAVILIAVLVDKKVKDLSAKAE